ncbi:acetyltransferase [Hyaloscypha variabilis F]|uniref:Acetyltransferase n=1 Tax=Hyaloscypha variabilis (strain UAMH 11265 / GT02V1 / F) TaxID=1149755 RepID=A0A2J6QTQ4_HYAVF|nr:acetyltransferase [Hyaloscypha variabilis F]
MPPIQISITSCTIADSPAITLNSLLATQHSQHNRLTWPHRTLSYRISQVNARMPRTLLADPLHARSQKALNPESGELLGYARWYEEGDGEIVWAEAVVPRVSKEEEERILREAESVEWDPKPGNAVMFEGVRGVKNEILGRRAFMRLDMLAVAPEHQKKGVGTALVRSGMREAEKLGLDIFAHATSEGVPLYKRLGFKIEREIVQDDSMYGGTGQHYTCFMIYEQDRGSYSNEAT